MNNQSLIPFQLVDIAQNLLDNKNKNKFETRQEYHKRLLSIKKFVDVSLKEYEKKYPKG